MTGSTGRFGVGFTDDPGVAADGAFLGRTLRLDSKEAAMGGIGELALIAIILIILLIIGIALVTFASGGLFILGVIFLVIVVIVLIALYFLLRILPLALAEAFVKVAGDDDDEEGEGRLRDWALDVLDRLEPILGKLRTALRERHGQRRIVDELRDDFVRLLALVRSRVGDFIDLADIGEPFRTLLKSRLRGQIDELLRRLREL